MSVAAEAGDGGHEFRVRRRNAASRPITSKPSTSSSGKAAKTLMLAARLWMPRSPTVRVASARVRALRCRRWMRSWQAE